MSIRKSIVSGENSFYPSDCDSLTKLIENCFLSEIGPGRLPGEYSPNLESIKGLIVPHAGFIYSGHEAAHSYLKLYETKLPETLIIIGPNHRGIGEEVSVYTGIGWETPFGTVETDLELTNKILENNLFKSDNSSHLYEHSIEMQLPFIKYIYDKASLTPKIVTISVIDQSFDTSKRIGSILGELLKNNENIVFIASSDFSHYVPINFAKKYDIIAIEEIIKFEFKEFYNKINEYGLSICGSGPIVSVAIASQICGSKKSKLLKYATSGDIINSKEVVGYGAILFN